ncbi:MAG: cob(I)yrinic acid a,c-diamide adenosyltransferase [Leptospiraceae bacterium]|nr:cob(I)yrinic acid a,c-diamide adenosyltransferase [Leptospiraceae bacterium]MCP5512118.1 cob(I)yrinic acid a,c-diamide adenosyltransferase [Leptospiraceae bacterium]
MKIYTKTGDTGMTSLARGGRVAKSDSRVEMYGTCDELNSSLGITVSLLTPNSELRDPLYFIQSLLFELGSELAGYLPPGRENSTSLNEEDIHYLENEIDRMNESLPELRSFILPGGTPPASHLHLSRTICRRLERIMVREKLEKGIVHEMGIRFINRLSDYLFVAARYENHCSKTEDVIWKSRNK